MTRLTGFDTKKYIPCLRTDDLVFTPRELDGRRSDSPRPPGSQPSSAATIRDGIGKLFSHFKAHGVRACAISLPPDFSPSAVNAGPGLDGALAKVLGGQGCADSRRMVSQFVFWTIAQFCAEFKLPFDLMIGVNRKVYPQGVYQGQDLFDHRVLADSI